MIVMRPTAMVTKVLGHFALIMMDLDLDLDLDLEWNPSNVTMVNSYPVPLSVMACVTVQERMIVMRPTAMVSKVLGICAVGILMIIQDLKQWYIERFPRRAICIDPRRNPNRRRKDIS